MDGGLWKFFFFFFLIATGGSFLLQHIHMIEYGVLPEMHLTSEGLVQKNGIEKLPFEVLSLTKLEVC